MVAFLRRVRRTKHESQIASDAMTLWATAWRGPCGSGTLLTGAPDSPLTRGSASAAGRIDVSAAKKAPLARLDQLGPQALEQVRRWGEQGEPAGEAQQ